MILKSAKLARGLPVKQQLNVFKVDSTNLITIVMNMSNNWITSLQVLREETSIKLNVTMFSETVYSQIIAAILKITSLQLRDFPRFLVCKHVTPARLKLLKTIDLLLQFVGVLALYCPLIDALKGMLVVHLASYTLYMYMYCTLA